MSSQRNLPHSVVVTGCQGFLGRHLVHALLEEGVRVVGVSRPRSRVVDFDATLGEASGNLRMVSSQSPDFKQAVGQSQAIVHLATVYGRNEETIQDQLEANVVLPSVLAECAASNRIPVLLADTFYNKPGIEYNHLAVYSATKSASFEICAAILANKAPLVRMHIEHMYGPGDRPDKALPALAARIVAGETEIALSPGDQKRDFVHVRDCTQAILHILSAVDRWPAESRVLEIGSGRANTLRYALETIKEISGSDSNLAFGALPRREGEPAISVADLSTLQSLGWRPRIELAVGLRELVDATCDTLQS